MNIKKTAIRLAALVAIASTLGGCVVVPVPFGHGGGGGYYHYRH